MTLSEELTWRGFVNQTTYDNITALDGEPISFYFGVDPSSNSMTIGNLAAAMMVKSFIKHGHKAYVLVGGATGMIGDPDGKSQERDLKSFEEVQANKKAIAAEYKKIFGDNSFELVDNYEWFKDFQFLDFLREIGKHVPMRQMLQREFVQSRLGENAAGISYAEFSYALIQGYDFLHLYKTYGVTLQVSGADQWGNCITGVDLIRRKLGVEANVYSVPLVVNKSTGKKFGKSEEGAIWLDPGKTSPFKFYQFWLNVEDESVEDYLKIFTELDKQSIDEIMQKFQNKRSERHAQKRLAFELTKLIHDDNQAKTQAHVAEAIAGQASVDLTESELQVLRKELPVVQIPDANASIVKVLVEAGLASSNSEARRLIGEGAITIGGNRITQDTLQDSDMGKRYSFIRRGKAYKDSAIIELG